MKDSNSKTKKALNIPPGLRLSLDERERLRKGIHNHPFFGNVVKNGWWNFQ